MWLCELWSIVLLTQSNVRVLLILGRAQRGVTGRMYLYRARVCWSDGSLLGYGRVSMLLYALM